MQLFMTEEKNRGDPPKEQKDAASAKEEQASDILLIMDQMKLIVRALSELEKQGKVRTLPADRQHQNSFLKFDRNSSVLENFIRNFWSQLKDPARMRLFRMPFSKFEKHREAIEDLTNGRQTDRVKEFLDKYEIRPKRTKQQTNINSKKEQIMTNQIQAASSSGQTGEAAKHRFNEAAIDWEQLRNFGLSKEYLQEKGLLDSMMRGYKTSLLVPVTMDFGSAVLRTDARLAFQQSVNGSVVLALYGIRREPELQKPYFGHVFSDEDRKNLKETGNMGRVVDLKMRGESIPSFISMDRLTNEIVSMRQENVFIPDEIKGVRLSVHEKEDLREGKPVYLEGMISNTGKEFDSTVQISAERRGIEFIFPEMGYLPLQKAHCCAFCFLK